MTEHQDTPEHVKRDPVVSLPVNVVRIKSLGDVVKGEADAEMLEELRQRLDVLAVKKYAIEARVTQWKKNGVRIEGKIDALVEQACVVTLKPVAETIDEDFLLTLLPEGSPYARRADDKATGGEMVVDPEGEDPPEEFVGDEIDVGSYAEEFLALALDDYPRADGVEFDGHVEDVKGSDVSENPFAALAGLKDKLGKDD